MSDRLGALGAREDSLAALVAAGPAPVLRIHPRLADVYAEKVAQLETSLNDPSIRDEAGQVIRSLVTEITLRQREGGEGGVDAILHGDLATILAFCDASDRKSKLPGAAAPGSLLSVVAGTHNRLNLLFCARGLNEFIVPRFGDSKPLTIFKRNIRLVATNK